MDGCRLHIRKVHDLTFIYIDHYAYDCECSGDCDCNVWIVDYASVTLGNGTHYRYQIDNSKKDLIREMFEGNIGVANLLKSLDIDYKLPKLFQVRKMLVSDIFDNRSGTETTFNLLKKKIHPIDYFAYIYCILDLHCFYDGKDNKNELKDCYEVMNEMYCDLDNYNCELDVMCAESRILEVI